MSEDSVNQMGSLLSRMTSATSDIKLNDNQVTAVIEVIIPRIATKMPGMPSGMECSVKSDDDGWTIRVDKP